MLISVNNKDLYEISGYYDLSLLFRDFKDVPEEEIKLWVTTKCYSYKEGEDWEQYISVFYMYLAMKAMDALRAGHSFSFLNNGITRSIKAIEI